MKKPSPNNYAWREYQVTPREWRAFEKRIEQEIAIERKQGKIKRFSGDLERDIK